MTPFGYVREQAIVYMVGYHPEVWSITCVGVYSASGRRDQPQAECLVAEAVTRRLQV